MKYNDAVALYQQTLKQLQQPQEWERFLQTAAKLYKYPFRDQVMIYAQRPDATAVASFDVWSLTMVRRIKAGTKGIALFDDNGERGKLKYGFDIADTIANSNSYVPNQWKFKLSDTEELERYIGETYNIPKQESLAQQIVLLSKRICSTSIERPSLERYNEPNEWRKSVSSSVAYIILERCGLQHDLHPVLPESISEDMLVELGATVNLVSKNLLTQIYQTIKKERGKHHEHRENNRRTDGHPIYQEGRTILSGIDRQGISEQTFGQIRENEKEIFGGESTNRLRSYVLQRNPVRTPTAGGRGSGGNAGEPHQGDGESRGRERGYEMQRPDGLGGTDEQYQEQSHRNRHRRTYQQLTLGGIPYQDIQKAESEKPSAFSFSEKQISVGGIEYLDTDSMSDHNEHGKTISQDFLKSLGLPPNSFRIEDAPVEEEADERFMVVITENGYAVWDSIWNEVYVDENGISKKFSSEWQATAYLQEVKEGKNVVSEKKSAKWQYVEQFYPDAVNSEETNQILVGCIEYLGTDGTPVEIVEYTNEEEFITTIEKANFYGVPLTVVLYRNEHGKTISQNFLENLDPPPNGFRIEDAPALVEKLKQQFGHEPENYIITNDNLGEGSAKLKYVCNVEAIKLLKQLEQENRDATPQEQNILSQYVGWGGLANCFEEKHAKYQELKELLTEEEYAAARASTLNAHYTSPIIIRAMYAGLKKMGFTGGKILEPSMGVGNFFGAMPKEMQQSSDLYGVELDSISGRIAKKLYPDADITIGGFETTNRRNFFDVAIGNVPFGQYKVNDLQLNKLNFSIHNYFFAKALDQVRPGGIVAFITSRHTMDSKDSSVRQYLAQRADLLGAIRLPDNAFKANAGTEVVSDIIFLQKRDTPMETMPDWVHSVQNEKGFWMNSFWINRFWINKYFVDNPQAVLGKQTQKSTAHGMDYTVSAISDTDLASQLEYAVSSFVSGTYTPVPTADLEEIQAEEARQTAEDSIKKYSFGIVDGKVYFRENDSMSLCELSGKPLERVKDLIELRDCVYTLINLQLEDAEEAKITAQQQNLNDLYDSFSKKHGLINSRANKIVFDRDSSYYLLSSLEQLDEDGNLSGKADIFTKRTIRPPRKITHADTAVEALGISLSEKGQVDLDYMSGLTGKSDEVLIKDLKGIIYQLPFSEPAVYVSADEYLSGNIREKLEQAKKAFEQDTSFFQNIRALEQVMPKDLDASEIAVRLGASWIDKEYITQFMHQTFQPPFWAKSRMRAEYSPITGVWNITGKSNISQNDVMAYTTYGTHRANAYRILEDSLNQRETKIYDTKEDADGKEIRVLNQKETSMASAKQDTIKQAFKDWLWEDPVRRNTLVEKYNHLFNSNRPREYDGSHLSFPAMNPQVQLRQHQKNAVARILYGGNTLLAHVVGAGKTFEMAAAAMESKRLGLCQKPMFVVPNHLTEQWGAEFLSLYPAAKILVATQRDFSTQNRKAFCARIATGDYDAVIIGHSQFEKIPMSHEYQEKILEQQLEEVQLGIASEKIKDGKSFSVKEMERSRKSLEAKLEQLRAENRKDDVVTFEQLGVDRLFVDEAHNYKNLFFVTKMQNVAGISTSNAQKSSDMFMKCRYLDELTGSRGVIFATGTPVSNSMVELYTMQRYLQYDRLNELGLMHFDSWAADFGETSTSFELSPTGKGFVPRTRFARFFNLPELTSVFKEVADIKTADELNLPRPKAAFINVAAKASPIQKQFMQRIAERAEKIKDGAVDPSEDNMLKITSDGRKLGLDPRLLDPSLPDDPNSKVNLCVNNIFEIWEKHTKAAQLVFCDTSTPKPQDGSGVFTDIYSDVKSKLIAKGIPENEIAFIHDAKTDQQKDILFKNVRAGKVRVLIGSTAKMGAGTNVQKRLIALHDLDCPWRPGDLEQRLGRILRQGNQNESVSVYRYVTEDTFDAYLWQTIENKQKFISQIMTSKSPMRVYEDADELALSYGEVKAICSSNPYLKEKMELDNKLIRLNLLKTGFDGTKYQLQDDLSKRLPAKLQQLKTIKETLTQDIETFEQQPKDEFSIELFGTTYTERAEAGKKLLDSLTTSKGKGSLPLDVGKYKNFSLSLDLDEFMDTWILTAKGSGEYRTELGIDGVGNMLRLENTIKGLPKRLENVQMEISDTQTQMNQAQQELQKPFPQAQELQATQQRLTTLNRLLRETSAKHSISETQHNIEATISC